MHDPEPTDAVYLPAVHVVHAAAADDVAPPWPYFPAAHKVPTHDDAEVSPDAPLYFPGGHDVHDDADEEKWATGQVTPECEVDPAGQKEPGDAEQGLQKDIPGRCCSTPSSAHAMQLYSFPDSTPLDRPSAQIPGSV